MKTKRIVALVLTVALAFGVAAGGTFAWLVAESETVSNTFALGDINITLEETKVNQDGVPVDEKGDPAVDTDGDGIIDNAAKTTTGNTYPLVPGQNITKDPVITVKANSEKCWLFVKLEKTPTTGNHTFDELMAYVVADGWTKVEENVYYRVADKAAADQSWQVIKDNKITVDPAVDKGTVDALNTAGIKPQLNITGYAVQYSAVDGSQFNNDLDRAKAAWALVTPINP